MIRNSCYGCIHVDKTIVDEPCFSCVRCASDSFIDYYEERDKNNEDHDEPTI